MKKKTWIGLAVALLVGLGAGFLLGPIARGMAPIVSTEVSSTSFREPRLQVLQVRGRVVAHTPEFRTTVGKGASIVRPAVLSVESSQGRAVLGQAEMKMLVEHGARVLLNASPSSNAFVLEAGFLLISSESEVVVHVPRHTVKVTGKTFSVWVDEAQVRAAVIEDSIDLQVGTEASKRYARRRDIIVSGGVVSFALLPPRIELSIEDVVRRAHGFAVRGQTDPRAIVLYRGEEAVERVPVRSTGAFTAVLPIPDPRSLAAYDGSGRWAVLDVPSPSIEDFMHVTFGEKNYSTKP